MINNQPQGIIAIKNAIKELKEKAPEGVVVCYGSERREGEGRVYRIKGRYKLYKGGPYGVGYALSVEHQVLRGGERWVLDESQSVFGFSKNEFFPDTGDEAFEVLMVGAALEAFKELDKELDAILSKKG